MGWFLDTRLIRPLFLFQRDHATLNNSTKHIPTWNPKQPVLNGCLVKLHVKIWFIIQLKQPFINGWLAIRFQANVETGNQPMAVTRLNCIFPQIIQQFPGTRNIYLYNNDWSTNPPPPNPYPPRNKGLRAGLIKGNHWLLRLYFWGGTLGGGLVD